MNLPARGVLWVGESPRSTAWLLLCEGRPASVALVERMLDPHRRLRDAQTKSDRELIERRIKATDDEIDAVVYELHRLTDEEIAIV